MKIAIPERNEALERALHPELLPHLDALLAILEMAIDLNPEPEALEAFIREDEAWTAAWSWADGLLRTERASGFGGNAYAVPFLHPDTCARLVSRARQLGEKGAWEPAEDEQPAYQIPEIVLAEHDERLHEILAAMVKYMDIFHLILYQAIPQSVRRIQFTKYAQGDTERGNWHHDRESDFTVVVSLNPGSFSGGGTDLRLTPTEYLTLQPLPAGYALLFNGKQLQHRGRPVEAGERHLLTFWLDSHPVA